MEGQKLIGFITIGDVIACLENKPTNVEFERKW